MMIDGIRELHDYTSERKITTTLENHGFFVNGSDRILHLIQSCGFDDVKMTLDVGNFQCVDEDSVAAVKKCLPYAEIIHLKDFYVRKKSALPGQTEMFNCNMGSWFETMGGRMLRGSILGQGDLYTYIYSRRQGVRLRRLYLARIRGHGALRAGHRDFARHGARYLGAGLINSGREHIGGTL